MGKKPNSRQVWLSGLKVGDTVVLHTVRGFVQKTGVVQQVTSDTDRRFKVDGQWYDQNGLDIIGVDVWGVMYAKPEGESV